MKLVLGLGMTGLSIVRFLSKHNITYRLADSRLQPPLLTDYLSELSIPKPVLGGWTKALLTDIDEVFISPGIAQNEPIVIWAREKNIPITSDIELFARHVKAPIIGITGSNGKSTVTQLLGEMIANSGIKVAVGGNIGNPALDCLNDKIKYYVLELSSYQLDYIQHLNLLTGAVLNITPDHLQRYANFEEYTKSKLSLYQYCQHPVVNIDEPLIPIKTNATRFGINLPEQAGDFGTVACHGSCFLLKGDKVLMDTKKIQLIGEHNISNILCALAIGEQIGLDLNSMLQTIKCFKGLEHRLEWVVKKQGIDYYNDSKATNAVATIQALKTLSKRHKNITLIIGGIKKQEDWRVLLKHIDKNVAHAILIGQSAQTLANGIHQAQTTHASSMQEAVALSQKTAKTAVLLSPACASFDMFDNFEHRGQVFKKCLNYS